MATYKEIQDWVKKHYGFVPKDCWIAHCKEINNIPVNKSPRRKGERLVPWPENKQPAIKAAFQHFEML